MVEKLENAVRVFTKPVGITLKRRVVSRLYRQHPWLTAVEISQRADPSAKMWIFRTRPSVLSGSRCLGAADPTRLR